MIYNCYLTCALLPFLVSAISGFIFTPQIISFCLKRKLYDLPNERKVHHSAIPRLGGVAFLPCMLLAFLVAMLVLSSLTPGIPVKVGLWSCVFLISIFMIYVVGIVDDLVGLGARTKFLVQIIAASLMPLSGLWVNDLYGLFGIYEIPFWVGAPITVFILVFIDNAMNLIDGIDGLSAGLALISLTGFLYCFARENIWTYCVMVSGNHCLPLLQLVWQGREEAKDIYGRLGQPYHRFHFGLLVHQVCYEQHCHHALPQRQPLAGLYAAHSALFRCGACGPHPHTQRHLNLPPR